MPGRRPELGVTRDGEPKRMPAAGRICGTEHGPSWCEDPVFSRGMCRRHYRRAARGQDIDPDDGKRAGVTPSGHGSWGAIERDPDTGRLCCHDCGHWYIALAVHIGIRHGSVRDYRMRHGLLMATPLSAITLTARQRETTRRNGGSERVINTRDPIRALEAVDPAAIERGRRLRRGQGQR